MSFLTSRRFNYTLVVGGAASALDWLALIAMVRVFHISPQVANVPSLMVGSLVQFLGNRHLVFNAHQGHFKRQAFEFITVEVAAFVLNSVLFYAMVAYTPINYALARPLGGFIVFFFFSYPFFKLVFRKVNSGSKN